MINYSNEQQEVVNFRSGFMRVTAPAGSGKTQTMAGLITGLVNEGVPEGKILATTFSNAGVKEMKHKFSRELGHECGIDVCTINSKQFEIVKDNYEELGFAKKPNVIDVVQRYAIIADLLAKYPILEWRGNSFLHFIPSPMAKGRSALEIVSNIFSAAKKSGKGIDEVGYNDVADLVIGTDISIQATNKILKLFKKYDEQLKERGLVDFDDQEVLSFRILEDHPGYLDKYGYQYVIIDEFQDTSLTQMEFVKYLKNMKSLKGLAVVGDPAQAIYGFRNTSPEYIINFEEYLNKPFQHVSASKSDLPDNPAVPVQDVELTKNFRSYQEVLDLGEEVLKCNKGDVLHVNAQRGTSGIRPIVNGYVSTKDEYADIVRIAGLLHDQGTAWEDICVLAATKEELSGIADAATRAGIPSFFGAPELMSKNPRIQAILAFYDVLNDPSNTASLVVAANAATHGALSNRKRRSGPFRIPAVSGRYRVRGRGAGQLPHRAGRQGLFGNAAVLPGFPAVWRGPGVPPPDCGAGHFPDNGTQLERAGMEIRLCGVRQVPPFPGRTRIEQVRHGRKKEVSIRCHHKGA